MFVFYIVLNEQVLNHWFTLLGIKKKKVGTSSMTSGGANSACNAATKATTADSTKAYSVKDTENL